MAKIPSAPERQFSLVLALVATPGGLARDEIFRAVHGYAEAYEQRVLAGERTPASLEQLFERDKRALREHGVPIERTPDPDYPDDNKRWRYAIPPGSFRMPDDLAFDAEEAALLEAAARVWQRGALASSAANSVTKLRALEIETMSTSALAAQPRLRSRDHGFLEIATAIEDRQAIGFPYRKQLAQAPEPRRIEPHALLRYAGRWLVAGLDLDRRAERRFVLARIAGPIRRLGPFGEGREPDPDAAARSRAALDALSASQSARIALRPGSDAEVRLPRRGTAAAPDARGWATVELPYTDIELLADELAGFGPEVLVLEPASLRDEVVRRLRRVLADHDGEGTPA